MHFPYLPWGKNVIRLWDWQGPKREQPPLLRQKSGMPAGQDLHMGRKARSLEGLEWSGELFEGSEGRPGWEARDVHRHEECYFAPTCNGKVALLWANAHVAYSGLCKDGYQRVTPLLC